MPTAGSSVLVVSRDLLSCPFPRGRCFCVASGGRKDQLTRRRAAGVLLVSQGGRTVTRHSPAIRGLLPLQTPKNRGLGSRGSRQACPLNTGLLRLPWRCRQGHRAPGAHVGRSHGATASELSSGVPSSGRASRVVRSNGTPGAVLRCLRLHRFAYLCERDVVCLPRGAHPREQGPGWLCSLP